MEISWNNDRTNHMCPRRRGFKLCLAHHWSDIFWNQTSISYVNLLSTWSLTNQQTSIWNLGSEPYFESCYFKEVTLFIRKFRVRLPYLLLIHGLMMLNCAFNFYLHLFPKQLIKHGLIASTIQSATSTRKWNLHRTQETTRSWFQLQQIPSISCTDFHPTG
jgi:hypothetical protein